MLDFSNNATDQIIALIAELECLPLREKVYAINKIKEALHEVSPFKSEPVDCVLWVAGETVTANDYNPNTVAPPEMDLLKHSILMDGYTQPIVVYPEEDQFIVVDGFHRNRVGKESAEVKDRVKGYLPVTPIRENQRGANDRVASTIRHNRARGKHGVDAMSDIVVELKRRNWSDERICKELGMDRDEVLRLCQITGLAELFSDTAFSAAWDIEGDITEEDFTWLDDDIGDEDFRRVHTGGDSRIFHTYEDWECYAAGFYNTTKEGMTKEECEQAYSEFLSDSDRFEKALQGVTKEWQKSCEHYLTNESMNRIAWLGQAAACYAMGIPSVFRSGFNLLTPIEQEAANQLALKYLNAWMAENNRPPVEMETAISGRQSDIY